MAKTKILEGQTIYRRWVVPPVPAAGIQRTVLVTMGGFVASDKVADMTYSLQLDCELGGGGLITSLYSACSHEHTTSTRVAVGWSMRGTEHNVVHMYPVCVNFFFAVFSFLGSHLISIIG